MQLFLFISGAIFILTGLWMLCFYARIRKRGILLAGEMQDIEDHGTSYGGGGSAHYIWVKFDFQGKELRLQTMNSFFLLPFWEKHKLEKLRSKHQGQKVSIYYNPKNPAQTVIKEFFWKEYVTGGVMMAGGIFFVLVGFLAK